MDADHLRWEDDHVKLLDMAKVTTSDGNWQKGWDAEDRMPGLQVSVADACDITAPTEILAGTDGTQKYRVRPFVILGAMDRSMLCSQDDDEKWMSQALQDAAEQAVGLALCTDHAADSESTIIDDNVVTAASILAARDLWFTKNVGVPTLHLASDTLLAAVQDGTVVTDFDGKYVTAWQDPVVHSPGYPATSAFWTGPIDVYLTPVDTDYLLKTLTNEGRIIANRVGLIDASPHQMVKVA